MKHCDDYIDDETQPECLRAFLEYARAPAHGSNLPGPKPKLFADYKGKRVRINMASRFGDVGYATELSSEYGYEGRIPVAWLSNFATDAQAIEARRAETGFPGSVHESAVATPCAQPSPGADQ